MKVPTSLIHRLISLTGPILLPFRAHILAYCIPASTLQRHVRLAVYRRRTIRLAKIITGVLTCETFDQSSEFLMSRLSRFCDDYPDLDNNYFASGSNAASHSLAALRATCLEWSATDKQSSGHHSAGHRRDLTSFSDLIAAETPSPCPLRVIFLPLSVSPKTRAEADGYAQLCRHFSIPAAVFEEAVQSVAYGFRAAQTSDGDADIAWCHFMSAGEAPVVATGQGRVSGVPPGTGSTWIRSIFFLHVRPEDHKSGQAKSVTLLCFSAEQCVASRFYHLLENDAWRDVLGEPFLLFDIVYAELFAMEDGFAWGLANRFRGVERSTLIQAEDQSSSETNVDFQNLHDISRNCIFLLESLDAVMATLDTMADHLRSLQTVSSTSFTNTAIQALAHRRRAFHSTSMRLGSLDKRIQNIIGLSFNLVTQSDSRVMKADSRAMKVIAVLTLVFLPATGVASIFSMPFFDVDFDGPARELKAAASFWIFWAVVAPLTIVVMLGWVLWYRRAKNRRKQELLASRHTKTR